MRRKRPPADRIGPRSDIAHRQGIAWFDPQTHARMQEIMLQPHDIPWSFERWRERAENDQRIGQSAKRMVLKIVIDPEAFLEWCAAHGFHPNGETLRRYVYLHAIGTLGRPLRKSPPRPRR